ncbi:transglutaminase family protein [Acetobacteraceae bacterium H6797]|nr:transglutaminase family protein [Acetobacteraceae bacterium H6797]
MIWQLRHMTTYAYGTPVDMATHMLHLSPRHLPWQRVISESINSAPAPAHVSQGVDHFGNRVTWIFIDRPHDRFEVESRAEIEVQFPAPPHAHQTMAWEKVASQAMHDAEAAEFALPSPMLQESLPARDYAAPSFPPGRPILEALLELNGRINRDFAFRAGVTSINTTVEQVLQNRAGVCQDFSQLMISGLRGLGIPARYASGYIRTRPPPGGIKRRGADQSHAWVSAWLGPGYGWVDLDPTNDVIVSDEHVVLGWGRDFGDVSPLRGVILGGGRHSLTVAVDLEPA